MLIILAGLPGCGKTTIAKHLARQLGAMHVRIDSIEQAIRDSGMFQQPDVGYRVGYAVAEDNLRVGQTVIADSVNPLAVTRNAWLAVATRAEVSAIEIELKCSNENEHKQRVETRTTDIPGLRLPVWQDVVSRDYQPWNRAHIVVDTAGQSVEQTLEVLRPELP